jgi:hypothetical protein
MDPKWHIAFCNVTYTEYAGVSYKDYYGSPAVMLEAQLKAREVAEQRWGVGRFVGVGVDSVGGAFASLFGMPIIEPTSDDEIPYLDTTRPPITDVADADQLSFGDPRTTGAMARRYEFWQYYRSRGYQVGFGGASGSVISSAMEITGNSVLAGMAMDPSNAWRVLDKVMEAEVAVATFSASLAGGEYHGFTYTGDDFSGLLSPAMYREFAVPCYQRLYGENQSRFMHSELLRAEHLRIARDEVGITDFHGAGCANLTLAEMHEIMGEKFWTQLTPQEMLEFTPAQIAERIKEFAQCGCWRVQLYPGRGTPDRNMEAAIAACQRECPGGPV